MVRIIAGKSKGNVLKVPKGTGKARPTSDRVKEAVFSSMGDFVEEAVVLDLFAGTGNLGLEALSRGAAHCFFVEKDNVCIRCLEGNIEKLGYKNKCTIFKGDFFKLIKKVNLSGINLFLADPPYDETHRLFSEDTNILNILLNSGIVAQFSYFVLEHSKKFELPGDIRGEFVWKTKNYGSTSVTIIELTGDAI